MTVQQMFNALPTLQKLLDLSLPIKKAYKIYNLAKSINEQREFFIEQEKRMMEECGAEPVDGRGLKFPDIEKQKRFIDAHNEMMNCEVDIKPLELDFNGLDAIELTPMELATLEGVINFIEN